LETVEAAFTEAGFSLLSSEYHNNHTYLDFVCPFGHEGKIYWNAFQQGVRCSRCAGSRDEDALMLEISKLYRGPVVRNTRDIIAPYELDFYFPELGVAIEYCGLYWHCELSGNKSPNYHRTKLDMCSSLGIRLITVFSDEFFSHRDVVVGRLSAAFGTSSAIYARKCKVVSVTKEETRSFLDSNHIQGYSSCSIRLGLVFEERLVAIMTFGGLSRGNRPGTLELKRYCSVAGLVVVGGFSKLLSALLRDVPAGINNIVSFADLRYAVLGK
jgi:hypothetical protein